MFGKWICRNVSVFRCCTHLCCNASSDDANNDLCGSNHANNYLCGYYHHIYLAANVSTCDSIEVDRRHLPHDRPDCRLNYS